MSNKEYEKDYSDDSFWGKIKNYAKKAGKELIGKALILFYTSKSPNTSVWAKTAIIGALGYFISPVDLIPDAIFGVGYTDDLGVVVATMKSVANYIDEDIEDKAEQKLLDWFG